VNESAFIDKAIFSLWGKKREVPSSEIRIIQNSPIGGDKSFYARRLQAVLVPTGNPVELRYGRIQPFRRLPPARLLLHSETTPMTGAQVVLAAQSLMQQPFRGHVSLLELTFDVTGFSISTLSRHLFTRARSERHIGDDLGRRTIYIGAPTSGWQLRIYQKTTSVVRIEFVLRLPFLRAQGVRRPQDVLLLSTLDLSRLVSFRELDQSRLRATINDVAEDWQRRVLLDWPRRYPTQKLEQILRTSYGAETSHLLVDSQAQHLLRRMQKRLVW
jgi:hypothetical protein